MRTFSWLTKEALFYFVILVGIDLIFFELSYATHFLTGKNVPFYFNLIIFLIYGVLLWIVWKVMRYLYFRIGRGMTGEDSVRRVLYKLPKENYYILPDLVIGTQGNIDFVVIGPTGVWTIEVKNRKAGKIELLDGKLCRDGYPINLESGKNVLSQAYGEAQSLQTYIRETLEIFTPVHPIIVFANKKTKLHFGYKQQQGVYAIGIPFLLSLLQEYHLDENLTPEKRITIKEELKKYTSKL